MVDVEQGGGGAQVRRGYKRTELGLLPKEWGVVELGGLLDFMVGFPFSSSAFNKAGRGIRLIKNRDLKSNDTVIHYDGEFDTRYIIDNGDVLVGMDGDFMPCWWNKGTALLNQRIGKLIVDNQKASTKYIYYSLLKPLKKLETETGATTVKHLSHYDVENICIPLPPLPEQRAIARALGDTDALLAALDGLIAKKAAIRRATLEDLLSGRRRLGGFEGEWEEIPLGNIASITTGTKNNQDKVDSGKYPFFVRSPKVESINDYSYDTEAILVPGEGNIGSIFHYINGKFEVHQRVYKIDNFSTRVEPKYVYWYMKMFFGKHAMENTVKATVDSLRLPTFTAFIVCLPIIKEQRAIAALLTTLDEELAALRARRAKLSAIKAGMMEELLTGRVRLG